MNVSFSVDYRTNWGESLYITGDIPALGSGDHSKALKLTLCGQQSWKIQLELPDNTSDFTYAYFVKNDNGSEKAEWGHGHHFRTGKGIKS